MKKYLDSKEIIKLESKLKNILSYFETLRMYSSNDESEFVFAFSKKNINSLQRIFMLVDEVYQLEE